MTQETTSQEVESQTNVLKPTKYLCLTICGYRKPGMNEEAYRHHMTKVSAPLTKDLMVKYGVRRWTMVDLSWPVSIFGRIKTYLLTGNQQIHNPITTRSLMSQLFDHQMSNIADFDCFSQVIFESLEDYKRMKEDPWYKEHLISDHENFADTKRSM